MINERIFHEKEKILLSSAYNESTNDKLIFDIKNEKKNDLILKNYFNIILKNMVRLFLKVSLISN